MTTYHTIEKLRWSRKRGCYEVVPDKPRDWNIPDPEGNFARAMQRALDDIKQDARSLDWPKGN